MKPVGVRDEPKGGPAAITWALVAPTADPTCRKFRSSGSQATWNHADQDNCSHAAEGP